MTDLIAETARNAAHRLAADLGPALPTDVEATLHTGGAPPGPDRYLDPVSLGGLIVSVATLAWTVYTDLKKRTPAPSRDVVVRTIRVQLSDTANLDPATRDRIIDVVVSETASLAGSGGQGTPDRDGA